MRTESKPKNLMPSILPLHQTTSHGRLAAWGSVGPLICERLGSARLERFYVPAVLLIDAGRNSDPENAATAELGRLRFKNWPLQNAQRHQAEYLRLVALRIKLGPQIPSKVH
jgi:hypothetical protein